MTLLSFKLVRNSTEQGRGVSVPSVFWHQLLLALSERPAAQHLETPRPVGSIVPSVGGVGLIQMQPLCQQKGGRLPVGSLSGLPEHTPGATQALPFLAARQYIGNTSHVNRRHFVFAGCDYGITVPFFFSTFLYFQELLPCEYINFITKSIQLLTL